MNGLYNGIQCIHTMDILFLQQVFYKLGTVEAALLTVADSQTSQPQSQIVVAVVVFQDGHGVDSAGNGLILRMTN